MIIINHVHQSRERERKGSDLHTDLTICYHTLVIYRGFQLCRVCFFLHIWCNHEKSAWSMVNGKKELRACVFVYINMKWVWTYRNIFRVVIIIIVIQSDSMQQTILEEQQEQQIHVRMLACFLLNELTFSFSALVTECKLSLLRSI